MCVNVSKIDVALAAVGDGVKGHIVYASAKGTFGGGVRNRKRKLMPSANNL